MGPILGNAVYQVEVESIGTKEQKLDTTYDETIKFRIYSFPDMKKIHAHDSVSPFGKVTM